MGTRRESFFCSTIGRKQLVGLTGLALGLFVMMHMLGNCLIFVSPELYNNYGHALTHSPLIYIAEVGLLAAVIAHILITVGLTIRNRASRGSNYAMPTNGAKAASLASRTMIFHGSILLVFIISHLITFKFGTHYEVTYNGVVMRDLARLMREVFQQPGYVVWYVISLWLLGMHLSHGVSSSFQTFGFNHPHYNKFVKYFGYVYAVVVTVGFIAQPVYLYLEYLKG